MKEYGECSMMDKDGGDEEEIGAEVNDVRASFKPTEGPVGRRRNTVRAGDDAARFWFVELDRTMRNTTCRLEALL